MSHATTTTAAPTAAEIAQIQRQVRSFILVGALQVLLTGITVWVSYRNFSGAGSQIAASLVVATLNATLVGAILMHLKWERKWIYWIMGFAFFFFGLMVYLSCLAFHDPIRPV